MAKDGTEVQVARINSRQAIIVALISAIAGIIGTLIGTGAFSGAEPVAAQQNWLKIDNVQMPTTFSFGNSGSSIDGVDKIKGLRVVAEINGRAVSYPSRTLWAEAGPEMSGEVFALPMNENYQVSFEIIAVTESGRMGRFISQKVEEFGVQQIPIENSYSLYEVGSEGSRSSTPKATIKYRLSDRSN